MSQPFLPPTRNDQPGQPYPTTQTVYPDVKPLPENWQKAVDPMYQNLQPQMPPGYYQQYQPQPQQNQPRAVKQWPWWATMLLVFVVFGGILVFAINGSKTPTTTSGGQQAAATAAPAGRATQVAPTATLGKVGEVLTLNGYSLTVNSVQKSQNFDTSNDLGKAKEGNIMLAVDITIGSNKAKGISANALYASLKDSQGFKYDLSIFGQKEPGMAGENDIPVGGKNRGWVTFEVPKTAGGFILEYGQMFDSEKIRVALGQ